MTTEDNKISLFSNVDLLSHFIPPKIQEQRKKTQAIGAPIIAGTSSDSDDL